MELIIDLSIFRKIKYPELLHQGHNVLVYIALFWRFIIYIYSFIKKEKKPMKVLVEGATGMHVTQSDILFGLSWSLLEIFDWPVILLYPQHRYS